MLKRKRLVYLSLSAVLFLIELFIALFVRDRFIRPYFGDVLVVILVYCAVRVVLPEKPRLLPIYVFVFAVFVEITQYLDLAELLGGGVFLETLIGTSFSWLDILCYLCGTILIYPLDVLIKHLSTLK
ncbi:MAG: DUF2809 domain-containing protein [Clostridia bacterium]|nr:DUF2809 domain-containing protein [Clostridia bacterium]